MRTSGSWRAWRVVAAGLLAAGALGALGVVPAAPAAAAAPASRLQLTVKPHGRDASTLVRTVTLACQPSRGKHPHAAAACTALDTAEGRLDQLSGTPGMACLKIYMPVTATADGVWEGRPVRWRRVFGNTCTLAAATGPVFHF